MKKIILFSLSLLLGSSVYAGTITTKVYLGPKDSGGACLGRRSLCTIMKTSVNQQDGTSANIELSGDQSTITITIDDIEAQTLPGEVLTSIQQGTFIQEIPFVFTADVATALGYYGNTLTVPVNTYTVVHNQTGYVITLTVIGS